MAATKKVTAAKLRRGKRAVRELEPFPQFATESCTLSARQTALKAERRALRLIQRLRWMALDSISPVEINVARTRVDYLDLEDDGAVTAALESDDKEERAAALIVTHFQNLGCAVAMRKVGDHSKRILITIDGTPFPASEADQLAEERELQRRANIVDGELTGIRAVKKMLKRIKREWADGDEEASRSISGLVALDLDDEPALTCAQQSRRSEDVATTFVLLYFQKRGFQIELTREPDGNVEVEIGWKKKKAEKADDEEADEE